MMTDMTDAEETPLGIDGAATAAHCSRSTIERGLARYRETDGAAGLRHTRRPRHAQRQVLRDGERGKVEINPADLQRWLDGLPPADAPAAMAAA